jgi:hypothetical protein
MKGKSDKIIASVNIKKVKGSKQEKLDEALAV